MNLDRLSVLCFAGTYALALVSDLARFLTRSPVRFYTTLALTALGWLVQSYFLAQNVARVGNVVLGGPRMAFLGLSWILVLIDLYLVIRSPRSSVIGTCVLALALAMIGVAMVAPGEEWAVFGGWIAFWGQVHGVLLTLGAVSTCLAFAFGVMYLWQSHRLKHKRPTRGPFVLPSLELSERWNQRAITLAYPLLTVGIALAFVLNAATHRSGVPVLSWGDPKIVATVAFWLVFSALLHARYRPEMRGRRVMILTMVAFAFMVFAMVGVGWLLPTTHGSRGAIATSTGSLGGGPS